MFCEYSKSLYFNREKLLPEPCDKKITISYQQITLQDHSSVGFINIVNHYCANNKELANTMTDFSAGLYTGYEITEYIAE